MPAEPTVARWHGATPVMAYDDQDIRVIFQPGGSDLLLVTFGDAVTLVNGLDFAADALARHHGLNALGFMAHAPNWFPVPSMARALPHVAYTLESFARRLLYGSSMGGYAALKYAGLLGATEVMALAPQWSIDRAECAPWVPGYQERFVPSMAGMGITARDMAGRIAVFLDPGLDSDVNHAGAITARAPEATVFHVHNTDHHPGPALAGSESMWRIMSAWLAGNAGAVRVALNQRRRASPIRTRVLLGKAVRRHPVLALRAISQVLERRGGDGLDSRDHVGTLLSQALSRGNLADAREVLHRAWAAWSPLRAEALDRDLASPAKPVQAAVRGLVTAHGGELFYDLIHGVLCHEPPGISPGRRPAWLHPATLGQAHGDTLLAVELHGKVVGCALDIFGQIELAELDAINRGQFVHATTAGATHFTLRLQNCFLCATPDGYVHHNRLQANAWEMFRLL